MDFTGYLKQYQQYLYSELTSLDSKDKLNRTLMNQKSQQLSKLLDLIDTLEEEATKYELMKDTHLELSHIETIEYPSDSY